MVEVTTRMIGKWYKEGILLSEYQKLRANVQQQYPYHIDKLSFEDWDMYKKERFEIKSNKLIQGRAELKELLYKSTRFSPNLDDDIIED